MKEEDNAATQLEEKKFQASPWKHGHNQSCVKVCCSVEDKEDIITEDKDSKYAGREIWGEVRGGRCDKGRVEGGVSF